MKNKTYIIISIMMLTLFLFSGGCLKDNITPPLIVEFENAAEILYYLESKGDYINSEEVPSVITAEELFANFSSYFVIDVSTPEEYAEGHIENSINLDTKDLISFLNSQQDTGTHDKVVLISRNGQSAAYYSGLLRLYGFENIYSLNWGMAGWHLDFAEDWIKAIGFNGQSNFVAEDFPKNKFTSLPPVSFENSSASIEEKVKRRIEQLLNEQYSESGDSFSGPLINREKFFEAFGGSSYIICYGEGGLYVSKLFGIGHPYGAPHYFPPPVFADLRSTRFLQTLPINKKIIIYTVDGNLGAYTVAYLRLLGYDASSLLFGANTLFYFGLLGVPSLNPYAFNTALVLNYPYIK